MNEDKIIYSIVKINQNMEYLLLTIAWDNDKIETVRLKKEKKYLWSRDKPDETLKYKAKKTKRKGCKSHVQVWLYHRFEKLLICFGLKETIITDKKWKKYVYVKDIQ